MNRIEIRGVIVPSDFDAEWTQEYIKKGIITPESYFRNNLKNAATTEPLEVYINSPGGSVFSAYEMVNAVRDWKIANKQPANITIGAMAASAASMFAVSVGSLVKAHRNAKMMFHGASSEMYGGKEALEDEAKLLGKINAEIQQVLIQKYKMNPDIVAEWFAEGRMGWLTAEEMLKTGIISEIIPDDSEEIKFDPEVVKAIDSKGLNIAALLEDPKNASGKSADNSSSNSKTAEATGADTKDGGKSKSSANAPVEKEKDFEAIGYARGQADTRVACELEYSKQLEVLTEQLSKRDALIKEHQSARDKAEGKIKENEKKADARELELNLKIDDLTKCLKDANERHGKLLAGGMTFTPAGPETWEEAMQTCNGNYEEAAKLDKSHKLRNEYNERKKIRK